MRIIAFISIAVAIVLLYLLSIASGNTSGFGQHYKTLLFLNIGLVVMLAILVSFQIWHLYKRIRQRVMGSRLTLRLLGAFTLMAIIPGLLVYAVSVNFLTQSIESWFNVKVESALDGGLKLGQRALDIMLTDLETKAESIATNLAFQSPSTHYSLLNDLREKSGIQDAALLSAQGRIIAVSSADPNSFLPELPSIPQLRQAQTRIYGKIEPIVDKGLYLRVLAPVSSSGLVGETRILQLLQPVPKSLSSTAESVQAVYQDYQELSYSRGSLKEVFSLTLTMVLMLAMLSALAIAFILSRRLSKPLMMLAEGTNKIASGDYSTILPAHGKDELGILVQSFNSMTRQLADATKAAERNRERVEAARGYLETILAHLSSGVIALNKKGELRTHNEAASNILDISLTQSIGFDIEKLREKHAKLQPFLQSIAAHAYSENRAQTNHEMQVQIELNNTHGKQILSVRGTQLPDGGYVVVFDDATTMIQAQRDAAWGEVARRLAHEIKNPLTPIQLSAERLQHKLQDKLTSDDANILSRATSTIVNQVNAMKSMVNEFSEYARSPTVNLVQLDLNQLINDVLTLYEDTNTQIILSLEPQLPHIMGDSTMLRQVLHNLLQNAQDALNDTSDPKIIIQTQHDKEAIQLHIIDNGCSFPTEMMSRAFEPYVTTKNHGTGLGLAVVKKVVDEHRGSVKIENTSQGACISITLPCAKATKERLSA